MTAYRPNRRDELTQRFARSLAEADENPWAYSEGRAEPQRLVVCADDDDAVDRLLRRWGLPAIVMLMALIVLGAL